MRPTGTGSSDSMTHSRRRGQASCGGTTLTTPRTEPGARCTGSRARPASHVLCIAGMPVSTTCSSHTPGSCFRRSFPTATISACISTRPPWRSERADLTAVEERIAWEAGILKSLLGAPVSAVSIHNPDSSLPWLKLSCLGGLVNTYGASLAERFSYVSDSNGLWRHRRLMDVVVHDAPPYLQVLTHPAWWVPEPMPARARIRRAIDGRARAVMQDYDQSLARYGTAERAMTDRIGVWFRHRLGAGLVRCAVCGNVPAKEYARDVLRDPCK